MRALLPLALLAGCGTLIDQMDVHPKVELPKSDQSMAIAADAVPNRMTLNHPSLMSGVKVSGLRLDLQRAFKNAFSPSHPMSDRDHADLVLVFKRAQPSLRTSGCDAAGVCQYDMLMRFDAELVTHDGKTTATFNKTLTAQGAGWDAATLSSLIAQMFETIAADLQ